MTDNFLCLNSEKTVTIYQTIYCYWVWLKEESIMWLFAFLGWTTQNLSHFLCPI